MGTRCTIAHTQNALDEEVPNDNHRRSDLHRPSGYERCHPSDGAILPRHQRGANPGHTRRREGSRARVYWTPAWQLHWILRRRLLQGDRRLAWQTRGADSHLRHRHRPAGGTGISSVSYTHLTLPTIYSV